MTQLTGSIAGTRLFCRRRWLNPDSQPDARVLADMHSRLCARYEDFASCPLPHFLNVVGGIARVWSVRTMDDDEFRQPTGSFPALLSASSSRRAWPSTSLAAPLTDRPAAELSAHALAPSSSAPDVSGPSPGAGNPASAAADPAAQLLLQTTRALPAASDTGDSDDREEGSGGFSCLAMRSMLNRGDDGGGVGGPGDGGTGPCSRERAESRGSRQSRRLGDPAGASSPFALSHAAVGGLPAALLSPDSPSPAFPSTAPAVQGPGSCFLQDGGESPPWTSASEGDSDDDSDDDSGSALGPGTAGLWMVTRATGQPAAAAASPGFAATPAAGGGHGPQAASGGVGGDVDMELHGAWGREMSPILEEWGPS